MKQYLSPEQTAKLIKLGFEKPKTPNFYSVGATWVQCEGDYSIGELIEMLPDEIYVDETTYSKVIDKTDVCYYSWALEVYAISICDVQEELIDNLYDMILKLKEEEII